jgi:uncharacterized protein (DUF2147 family)
MTFKATVLTIAMAFGYNAGAGIQWSDYSPGAVSQASQKGDIVLLGFHKKGCGTCVTQDQALVEAGINNISNLLTLRVERKDKKLTEVYEAYGLGKKEWSAMVALKDGKEIARLNPGTTSKKEVEAFVQKISQVKL